MAKRWSRAGDVCPLGGARWSYLDKRELEFDDDDDGERGDFGGWKMRREKMKQGESLREKKGRERTGRPNIAERPFTAKREACVQW